MREYHIARTRAGKDRIAANALKGRGYEEVWRPEVPYKTVNRLKQTVVVKRSLFPSYLFVLPRHERETWKDLKTAPGISDHALLFGPTKGYATITEGSDAHRAILDAVAAEEANAQAWAEPQLQLGDLVRLEGLFEGVRARILACSKNEVLVLLRTRVEGQLNEIRAWIERGRVKRLSA
jgi:transcription antitermination factor NusG